MKLGAEFRLYALGAVILVALVSCSRFGIGTPPFIFWAAIAATTYLLAVRELFRSQRFPTRVIYVCLAMAALWRLPFFLTPSGPDDDVHRYVWDGRMQRLGYNPYVVIPADPAFAALHTSETRGLNNPDIPSPYPAGAQLFFRTITAIHESTIAFKIAFAACDLAIVLLLFSMLRRSGQGAHWVLAYAWHPLLAINATSGHVDIFGVLLLLISAAALERKWRATAAITFALAVAVKFLPIVLVPLYWRRLRIRDVLLAVLTFGLLYLPFLQPRRIPIGSLPIYVQSFRFNDLVFANIERLLTPQIAASLAVLVGLAAAVSMRRHHQSCWDDSWVWPMGASLLCAPVIYPWYLLWLVPFLRSVRALPLFIWTVSIIPTYVVWYLRSLGREWQVPSWILLTEYGSLALAAVAISLYRPMPNEVAVEEALKQ